MDTVLFKKTSLPERGIYLFILCFVFHGSALGQTSLAETITFDGIERNYIIHLPPSYNEEANLPLVFNFHGLGSNALQQEFYSDMNRVADEKEFIVCYPNGVDGIWNVGFGGDQDDVGFVLALIDHLATNYHIDLTRVFSCGMSNGGYFSYRLACEATDRIAAIASVTGSIVPNRLAQCIPGRPIPIMQIHGTQDGTVPYDGFAFGISQEALITFWKESNNCSTLPDTTEIPDIVIEDGVTGIRIDYTDCEGISQIAFYRLEGGGHTWPGSPLIIGPTSLDFSASEVIWDFFKQFSLDGISTSTETADNTEELTLYPIPAENFAFLEFTGKIQDISVFDISGNKVINLHGDMGNRHRLDISGLSKGLYFVHINNSGYLIRKIIKL